METERGAGEIGGAGKRGQREREWLAARRWRAGHRAIEIANVGIVTADGRGSVYRDRVASKADGGFCRAECGGGATARGATQRIPRLQAQAKDSQEREPPTLASVRCNEPCYPLCSLAHSAVFCGRAAWRSPNRRSPCSCRIEANAHFVTNRKERCAFTPRHAPRQS